MSDTPQLIQKYFPDLTATQINQFEKLGSLYADWNSKINVISRKDIESLYTRHVLHSLGIAKVMSFKNFTEVLDVGTGGGFPGIPLSILFPQSNFHLVDSIGKNIKVVQAIADGLGLENVVAEHTRAEQVKEQYDFVVSRAVTRLKPFLQWVQNKFLPNSFNELTNGVLYLKGGDLGEELSEVKRPKKVYDLSEFFEEDFFETKKVVYVQMKK
jgi:16S rRNA (guanine527-N7)-methyltransferase